MGPHCANKHGEAPLQRTGQVEPGAAVELACLPSRSRGCAPGCPHGLAQGRRLMTAGAQGRWMAWDQGQCGHGRRRRVWASRVQVSSDHPGTWLPAEMVRLWAGQQSRTHMGLAHLLCLGHSTLASPPYSRRAPSTMGSGPPLGSHIPGASPTKALTTPCCHCLRMGLSPLLDFEPSSRCDVPSTACNRHNSGEIF